MTSSLPARIMRAVSLPVFLAMMATPLWAQEGSAFAKNGGYVGASTLLNFSFGSDTFDGLSAYQREGGEEIVILPRFSGAHNVLRLVGGYRSGRGAFEFSYDRTNHTATFYDLPGEATFHVLNFDERVYLLTGNRIQPHVLLGDHFVAEDQGRKLSRSRCGRRELQRVRCEYRSGRHSLSTPAVRDQRRVPIPDHVVRQRQRRHPHRRQSPTALPRNLRQRRDYRTLYVLAERVSRSVTTRRGV